MTRTGGEIVLGALEQAGSRHIFGVPGESFLGLLDALYSSPVSFISTRHEGAAAFMASGYSKASGEIGVCIGTRAVGTANLAIGIHNARQDSTPMIAIAGQVNRSFIGREAFQEVDLVAAMTPFAKWAVQIPDAASAPEIMARALNLATSGRPGPVFLALPQDVCDELSDEELRPLPRRLAPAPSPEAVSLIAGALRDAQSPLILAGGGLLNSPGAPELLVELAEAAEVPVITGWRHHDLFPNDHRLFLGCAGLGAPPVVWDRLGRADVLVVLGSRMQENGTNGYRYPEPRTRLFQVDLDPGVMVNHRSPEVTVQADVGETLRELLAALGREPPVQQRAGNVADRGAFEEATRLPAEVPGDGGVSYPEVVRGLGAVLGPEAVIASDAGNFYGWLARYLRFQRPRTYLGPASGAMGYGLPAAIGARLARPEVPVVSVSGDGGFLMTMAEIETAVRHRAAVVAVVLDNSRHGTIRVHQENHHPGRVVGTELGATDLSLVARGLGAEGYAVGAPGGFEEALRDALSLQSPAVVHVQMDRAQLSVDVRREDLG